MSDRNPTLEWTEDRIRRERDWHRSRPRVRPTHVVRPGPGQESVWDYPRPPRIEPESRLVRVALGGEEVARSTRARRVLETSSPPTIYVPPEDVRQDLLEPWGGRTLCEWKGLAVHWRPRAQLPSEAEVAWSYPEPFPEYAVLASYFAFFPARVDACWLGEERVRPQPGDYYGGWVTDEIVGPFKGGPGTAAW